MSDRTNKLTDEATAQVKFDTVALFAIAGLVVFIGLLAALVAYARLAENPWLSWLLERRWLVALAATLAALIVLLAVDLARRKNVAWRLIERQYGDRAGDISRGKTHAAGTGRVGVHSYWGLRCFGSASSLAIVRVMSAANRPLLIPWSEISAVETNPSPLTGRPGFETDMEARITLRDQASLTIEVPWLAEFRALLPKAVKVRATKLPGQAPPKPPSKRRRRRRS